ncbi:MAG: hypothetical protein L0H93_04610 [Nocardioides sp.]|nr:hypothetical protein [Nocardioides sp.]
MSAPLIDDLSSAHKLLHRTEDSTTRALGLVDPLSKRLSDEVAGALKALENATERLARAVAALEGHV